MIETINYSAFRTRQKSFLSKDGEIKFIDEGSGPTLLLLHGIPTSGWLFRKMITPLVDEGYRVIVPDMLGFGGSDSPKGYEIYSEPNQAQRLLDLMDSLMLKIYAIGSTNIKEIYVEGHTDSFASDAYNVVLAANRADAAVKALEQIGVPSRFIKTESFGESKLISEEQSTNRRAKIFFV